MKFTITLLITMACAHAGWSESTEISGDHDLDHTQTSLSDFAYNLDESAASNIDWDYWKTQGQNLLGAGLLASYGAKMLLKYVAPIVAEDLVAWVKANVPSVEAANYLFGQLYSAYQSATKWTKDQVLELTAKIITELSSKYLVPVATEVAKSTLNTVLQILLIR